MWCIFCEQPICHKEKSTAKHHIGIPRHKKAKHDYPKLVKTPGLSAPVESKSDAPVESKSEEPEVSNNRGVRRKGSLGFGESQL